MITLKLTGELQDAGELTGTEVTIDADLDAILEKIEPETIIEEIDERYANGCPVVTAALQQWADTFDNSPDEPEWEPWFEPMSDWDKDELRKAIRLDDGRRAIELLKRAICSI